MKTSNQARAVGGIAAVILAIALTACSSSVSAGDADGDADAGNDDAPVEFSWGVPTAAYVALYAAQDRGYFEDEGLKPDFKTFQTGAPLLAGLQSDSLDIATSGLASVFALGQGIDIRIFGFEGGTSLTEGLVAREGSSIKSIADLDNGQPVGIATGTCAQISALFAADKAGIDYSDINVVDIAPNLFANSFESASIDAGFAWSPYILDLKRDGGATVVGWDGDWVPGGASCPQTHYGRSAFLDAHPEVPVKIVKALDRAWADVREDPSIGAAALLARLGGSEDTALDVVKRTVEVQPTLEELGSSDSIYSFDGAQGLIAQLDQASAAFVELGVIADPLSAETLEKAVDPTAIQTVLDGK